MFQFKIAIHYFNQINSNYICIIKFKDIFKTDDHNNDFGMKKNLFHLFSLNFIIERIIFYLFVNDQNY